MFPKLAGHLSPDLGIYFRNPVIADYAETQQFCGIERAVSQSGLYRMNLF
jgi:hypothetical protein